MPSVQSTVQIAGSQFVKADETRCNIYIRDWMGVPKYPLSAKFSPKYQLKAKNLTKYNISYQLKFAIIS